MATLQILISLCGYLAIYLALRTFEVGQRWAVAAVLLLVLNPSAIEFEFDALYTVWVFALHCLAALTLARFLQFRRTEALAVFFSLLAADDSSSIAIPMGVGRSLSVAAGGPAKEGSSPHLDMGSRRASITTALVRQELSAISAF
jgi:hypothetical protein